MLSGALYEAMQEDLRQARLQEEAQCKGLAWASVRERELEALEKKEEEALTASKVWKPSASCSACARGMPD